MMYLSVDPCVSTICDFTIVLNVGHFKIWQTLKTCLLTRSVKNINLYMMKIATISNLKCLFFYCFMITVIIKNRKVSQVDKHINI